ncbi:MAG: hypothetical protein KF773_34065 [Deltaproteobacteria bacterium]|nr:hypothetical protein [Deltaproteobacteria bacterium]MCW5801229.1 hypothetical protein [Deltaproteobacteria bacterium]
MRTRLVVALALVGAGGVARADDVPRLYDRLWPRMPLTPYGRDFGEQLEDQLTALGNQLGQHVSLLSKDMLIVRVDGRRRRASIRLGTTADRERNLTFRIENDIDFTEGFARVNTRIDLGIKHHVFRLELPDWEMAPVEYRGDYGVELRLPLLRRTF